jgi:hypothetical protein
MEFGYIINTVLCNIAAAAETTTILANIATWKLFGPNFI